MQSNRIIKWRQKYFLPPTLFYQQTPGGNKIWTFLFRFHGKLLIPKYYKKAINSGSNYRTYCDEKSWDISFEIEFLEKEEIIFLLLVGAMDAAKAELAVKDK